MRPFWGQGEGSPVGLCLSHPNDVALPKGEGTRVAWKGFLRRSHPTLPAQEPDSLVQVLCETRGQRLTLPVPRFPHLQNEKNDTHLLGL